MNIIHKILGFFRSAINSGKTTGNQRAFTRLDGKNMTVSVNGASFNVVNWSQGGLLLYPNNNNVPNIDTRLDLTLKLSQGDNIISLAHAGHILRRDNNGIVVILNPFEDIPPKQLSHMVDAVLTENFLNSQAA